jgi:hypothetical protein
MGIQKNGLTHYGKQNHKCSTCSRQFVEGGSNWFISKEQKGLVDKLLLERISLNGIIRVTGVSCGWLQSYIKELYSSVPKDLGALNSMPNLESWLDDKMDEEIGRLECVKKIRRHWKSLKR